MSKTLLAILLCAFASLTHGQDPRTIDERTVGVTGTRLTYVERGSGTPVVFVHGALSDYRHWQAQLNANIDGYRLLAYSRRDFYPNPGDSAPSLQTGDRDVIDLIELIEQLELPPAHLVGHSSGAHVAILTAIRRPDLVRALVLAEGGFVSDVPESARAIAEIAPVAARSVELRAAGQNEKAIAHFLDFVSGEHYVRNAPAETRRIFFDNVDTMGVRSNDDLTCADVASIEQPVLVVLGERSPTYFDRLLSGLRDCLRQESTVTIRGASHGLYHEQPEAFNSVVFSFLAEH